MKPQKLTLAEDVFLWNEIDNIGILDLGKGGAIVDTHEDASVKEPILEYVNTCLRGKAVFYVLNTHLHYDHLLLNPYFEERGAEAVSLKKFPQGTTVKGDSISVEMFSVAGCHSDYDAAFWIPERRILFTGDIFGWGLVPWEPSLTDEKIALIKDAYQKFIDHDPVCVIPGHGPVCKRSHLERWLTYFDDMIETAKQMRAEGLSQSQAINRIPPPQDMLDWWRFVEWKHQFTLERVVPYVYKKQSE